MSTRPSTGSAATSGADTEADAAAVAFAPPFNTLKKRLPRPDVWPALSVGYRYAAVATRMMRSSLLEVMREDYIRTARAKGVWTRLIMRRHALRNAMLPVVTVIGWSSPS